LSSSQSRTGQAGTGHTFRAVWDRR